MAQPRVRQAQRRRVAVLAGLLLAATSSRLDAAMGDPERFITYGCRPVQTVPEAAKLNSVRNERDESPLLQGAP